MKNKNLILAIGASLYSGNFYREVGERWRGRSFVYLLVLLAILWLFISFKITSQVATALDHVMATVPTQIPTMEFKKGVAKTQVKKAFYIVWPETKEVIAIIDTHNTIQDLHKQNVPIIMTDSMITVHSDRETRTFQLPKKMTGTLTPQTIQKFYLKAKKYIYGIFFIIVYTFALVFIYGIYIIMGLIYALLGMIYNAILKRKLRYSALLSLALVAMTPSILLNTVLMATTLRLPFKSWLMFILTMIYLFFAVKAANKPEVVESK